MLERVQEMRPSITAAILFFAAAGMVFGQTEAPRSFEVASVKMFPDVRQEISRLLDSEFEVLSAVEEDAYDGEQRNDDGGDRSHGWFLSIEQDLDDAHDLSDDGDQEKQQSPVRACVISWGWLRSVIAPDFVEVS